MSNFLRYLHSEHDFEHKLKTKKRYSEPKIYDGKGDLSKRWYVYFSYRKLIDNPLERFPINIYAHQYLNKNERFEWLKYIQQKISIHLKDDFSPYKPDDKFNFESENSENKSIKDAFEFVLNIKKSTLAELTLMA